MTDIDQGLTWMALVLLLGACGSSGGANATAIAGSAGMSVGAAGNAGMNAGAAGSAGISAGGASTAGQGGAASGGSATAGTSPTAGETSGGGMGGVGTRCNINQPFTTLNELVQLNTSRHEAGARLTPDELTIVYLCGSTHTICLAQRKARKDPFGTPQLVNSSGGVPWISDDALTLLFDDSIGKTISRSQRLTVQDSFPAGMPIPQLMGVAEPFVVGGPSGHLYLADQATGDLSVATLKDWAPSAPQPVPGGSTTDPDVRPVLTPDELTIYFGSAPSPGAPPGALDIWVRQRQSTNEDFGAAVNVANLNMAQYNLPSWISPDGCRLYFDAGGSTRNLYVAER